MRKYNIFAKWWFSLLLVPSVIFIFGLFANSTDGVMFGWLTIFILALSLQIYFNTVNLVQNQSLHFLYILICINFMMFFGYIASEYSGIYDKIHEKMPWWVAKLLASIIIGIIAFIIKYIIWFLLALKWKKMNNVEEYKNQLEKDLNDAKLKIEELKEMIEKE